jgi:hypothetical protein
MATTISGNTRVAPTTLTTTDAPAPETAAKPVDAGFAGASTFQRVGAKAGDAKEVVKSSLSVAENVDRLATTIFSPQAGNEARAESVAESAGALVGAAQGAKSLATAGTRLVAGKSAAETLSAKTKIADKALGTAGNAATLLDGKAGVTERLSAGVELARDLVHTVGEAGARFKPAMEVAGRFAGGAAGVVGLVNNGSAAIDSFKKARQGDTKAAFDTVSSTLQTASAALTTVEHAATGAQLLKVGGAVAGKALDLVAAGGPLLKKLPVVGAAIGTAKAAYDFATNPSWVGAAKVATNAIGMAGPVGAAVSFVATAALEHPDLVSAGASAVSSAASKAWSWVSGG